MNDVFKSSEQTIEKTIVVNSISSRLGRSDMTKYYGQYTDDEIQHWRNVDFAHVQGLEDGRFPAMQLESAYVTQYPLRQRHYLNRPNVFATVATTAIYTAFQLLQEQHSLVTVIDYLGTKRAQLAQASNLSYEDKLPFGHSRGISTPIEDELDPDFRRSTCSLHTYIYDAFDARDLGRLSSDVRARAAFECYKEHIVENFLETMLGITSVKDFFSSPLTGMYADYGIFDMDSFAREDDDDDEQQPIRTYFNYFKYSTAEIPPNTFCFRSKRNLPISTDFPDTDVVVLNDKERKVSICVSGNHNERHDVLAVNKILEIPLVEDMKHWAVFSGTDDTIVEQPCSPDLRILFAPTLATPTTRAAMTPGQETVPVYYISSPSRACTTPIYLGALSFSFSTTESDLTRIEYMDAFGYAGDPGPLLFVLQNLYMQFYETMSISFSSRQASLLQKQRHALHLILLIIYIMEHHVPHLRGGGSTTEWLFVVLLKMFVHLAHEYDGEDEEVMKLEAKFGRDLIHFYLPETFELWSFAVTNSFRTFEEQVYSYLTSPL